MGDVSFNYAIHEHDAIQPFFTMQLHSDSLLHPLIMNQCNAVSWYQWHSPPASPCYEKKSLMYLFLLLFLLLRHPPPPDEVLLAEQNKDELNEQREGHAEENKLWVSTPLQM